MSGQKTFLYRISAIAAGDQKKRSDDFKMTSHLKKKQKQSCALGKKKLQGTSFKLIPLLHGGKRFYSSKCGMESNI